MLFRPPPGRAKAIGGTIGSSEEWISVPILAVAIGVIVAVAGDGIII
jgi:hypothetical protein